MARHDGHAGRRRGRPDHHWSVHDDRERRPGTVVAGAFVMLLLLAAGTVALVGDDGSVEVPVPSAPVTAPVGSSVGQSSAAEVEPAGPGQAAEPLLVAPEGVEWQLFMGVALPYASAGPRTVEGPVYGGFARSQTGALLAAVHLGTRYLLTPGEGWREVAERQVLPGDGRDAFIRNRAGVDPQAPPGTYGQIAGFRVVTWSPDVAVVQLVSRFPTSGVLQVTTTTVRWAGGDWRLQLQPNGGTSPTAQAVGSLDGFVVWGV